MEAHLAAIHIPTDHREFGGLLLAKVTKSYGGLNATGII